MEERSRSKSYRSVRAAGALVAWVCFAGLAVGQEHQTEEAEIDAVIRTAASPVAGAAPAVWSELGPAIWTTRTYHHISPDVMVAEAEAVRTGSSGYQVRIPVIFVLRKVRDRWEIAVQRELASDVLSGVPPGDRRSTNHRP